LPSTHWASSVHVTGQAVHTTGQAAAEQMNGAQSCTAGIEQVPPPVHVPAGWKFPAGVQPKPEHIRPAAPCVHAPLVQVPVLPQGGFGEHWPAGAGPLAIGVQVPGLVPAQV
jgi:hypothetical protein